MLLKDHNVALWVKRLHALLRGARFVHPQAGLLMGNLALQVGKLQRRPTEFVPFDVKTVTSRPPPCGLFFMRGRYTPGKPDL